MEEDNSDTNSNNFMSNKVMAVIALLFAASVWGLEYVAIKDILTSVSPYCINFIRFASAFLILFIIFHRKLKNINKFEILSGVISGIAMAISHNAQAIGLESVEAGTSAFLANTTVIIIPIFVWMIYKKRPKNKVFISAFLCLIGIGMLSLGDNLIFELGSLFSIADAVFFSAQIICVEYFSKKSDTIVVTMIQFITVAVVSLMIILLSGESMIMDANILTIGVVGKFAFIVLISTVLCQVLCNEAVSYVSSSQADITLATETIFASFFGWLILDEAVTMKLLVGGAFILSGILISDVEFKSEKASTWKKRRYRNINKKHVKQY